MMEISKSLLTHSLLMRHISGLHEYKSGSLVTLAVYGDRLEFNNKQTIPFSRIKNCELGTDTITFEGHPIASAIGLGLISAYVGAWLYYLGNDRNSGSFAFVCGSIGAIIGAISGLKSRKRNVPLLKINYCNVKGEEVVICLRKKSKSRKLMAHITATINNAVGYTPIRETEQFTERRYEI